MEDEIKKILETAVYAPSGGNSQPWQFRVREGQIEVFALPERDHPILNFRNRGTWIAHGALLENIFIVAAHLGYEAHFQIFPDKNRPTLTAAISLEKGSGGDDLLFTAIKARATNRKPYEMRPLTVEQRAELLKTQQEVGGGEIRFIEEAEKIRVVAQAMSVNEVVMLENKKLHQLFFNEVVWTKEEERRRGGGLLLKTLELKLPQQGMLKLLRHWSIMRFANHLGIAKLIARDNAKVYASCGAMGAIIVEDCDYSFIAAGRLLQRLWLKAARMGLSLHLITGVLFLHQKIAAGEAEEFSQAQVELIRNAYGTVAKAFEVVDGVVALLFRIGFDGEPSERSIKLPPRIIV